jgi:hypothetical protein
MPAKGGSVGTNVGTAKQKKSDPMGSGVPQTFREDVLFTRLEQSQTEDYGRVLRHPQRAASPLLLRPVRFLSRTVATAGKYEGFARISGTIFTLIQVQKKSLVCRVSVCARNA